MVISSRFILVFCLLAGSLSFVACSKEEKPFNPPVITWLTPANNASFTALDTVLIKASINHNQNISLIKIRLKNSNGVPVLQIPDLNPNTGQYELKREFILRKEDLSGPHYFEIEAYSDDQFSASFRNINITPFPIRVDHTLFFSGNSVQTSVYTEKDGILEQLTTASGDILGTAVNQDARQIYFSGKYGGSLLAIEPSKGTELWKFSKGSLPQVPNYNDLIQSEEYVLASLEDGRLMGFTVTGSTYYESVLENGFRPGKLHLHQGDQVVFQQFDRSSGQSTIQVEYFPSTLEKGNAFFSFGNVVAIYSIDWNKVLLFSNASDGQYIFEYNTEDHSLTQLDKGNYGEFTAFCRIDENQLVMTRGTDLYSYYIDQRQFLSLKSGYAPTCIRFNKVSLSLYCIEGIILRQIDPSSGTILGEQNLSKTMNSMEFMYNY